MIHIFQTTMLPMVVLFTTTEEPLNVYNSKFFSNHARQLGGAIKNWGGCEVYDSIFIDNSADVSGGALYTFEHFMKVQNLFVENNSADYGG